MELLANERSIHEQFHDIASFRDAFACLMSMRAAARRFDREVHCHRMLVNARPAPDMPMQQAVSRAFPNDDQRRAAMTWLTRAGPFWDDVRRHGADDWLECRDDVVTDSAVGEAAFRTLHGVECGLVSVTPSDWDFSPVEVVWRREAEGLGDRRAKVDNWRDAGALEDGLRKVAPPIQSWEALRETSESRFENLTFAADCFDPLDGVPFAGSSVNRLLVLLEHLNLLAGAFDAAGKRTAEGQRIYRDYFTGANAPFSDSSDAEKRDFRNGLTFPNPASPEESLFCPWHGKEHHLTLRLHFSWPVQAGEPVYVVYAGPKVTKR